MAKYCAIFMLFIILLLYLYQIFCELYSVFLDLKRAFETTDRMVQKLSQFENFNKIALMEFYLRSEKCSLVCRRALLFILYMNDIVKAISHSQVNLFADDTLLSVSASTVVRSDVNRSSIIDY
jgi:hypothetical protein